MDPRRDKAIEWATWLETIQSNPSRLTDELDSVFDLEELGDESELKAIKHALQSHDDRVLFLEGEESGSDDGMLAYRFGSEWTVRTLAPDTSRDRISKFLHYTMNVVDCIKESQEDSEYGDYYSLRPLVYGGNYWLDTVCRQEFNRYQDLKEKGILSVIAVSWRKDWSLFDLVESLRRGDRVGYFEDLLGILLPFTDAGQMGAVSERLTNRFEINRIHCWQVERDFENVHQLTKKVEELL